MPCGGCQGRRERLSAAVRAVADGDLQKAAGEVGEAARSLRRDAVAAASGVKRLAAAHARLKR